MLRRGTTLLFLALLLPLVSLRATPFTAFVDGERYVYKVGWGVLGGAGEIVIAARADVLNGRPVMRITTQTSSRGLVRGIYRYDDTAEVVVDRETSRLVYTFEQGEDSKRKTESRTDFDYTKGLALHRDKYRPHRNSDLPIPPGDPIDLISSLVVPRNWAMKPGDARDLLVHFGREFFPLTLHAEQFETVRTPMGSFKALRLVPRMDKEKPRGLFERGGEIKVWISDGDRPLPVRMQLKLNFGTATLSLQEHTVPAAGAAL
ncbi:MAG TPA: DUF3108 domain-containing protein [Opitutaceae bacterium]